MQHGESDFQQAAVRMLRTCGFYLFSVPNGTRLRPTQARIAVSEGLMAGVSDIIVLLPKRAVFIEFKNPNGKGRQSPPQRQFEELVLGLGFEYLLWDNWAQVEAFINDNRATVAELYKVGGSD